MPYKIGHATKAANILSNSSGLTLTIPGVAGVKISILSLLILNGSSFLNIDDNISITNVDQDTPVNIPLGQLATTPTETDINFGEEGQYLLASAVNTAMVVTVPVLLGGAYTFIKVDYAYV